MKRLLAIWWAHARANMHCLGMFARFTIASNPELVPNVPLAYIRYSVEPEGKRQKPVKRTRQVSVGHWERAMIRGQPDRWVSTKTYYLEEYDMRTQTWKRVK